MLCRPAGSCMFPRKLAKPPARPLDLAGQVLPVSAAALPSVAVKIVSLDAKGMQRGRYRISIFHANQRFLTPWVIKPAMIRAGLRCPLAGGLRCECTESFLLWVHS